MVQSERDEQRVSYLAFVEKHWHELTLRDAVMLAFERPDETLASREFVKDVITFS